MTIRDELVRLEQDRLELDSARITLHHSLQDVEQRQAGMEAELQSVRADRVKLQDRVTQVKNRLYHISSDKVRLKWLLVKCNDYDKRFLFHFSGFNDSFVVR